ncbi:MAG: hypothetical protein PWQ57_1483 [Desulfovibrionales bacterium]|jgi:FkbM family methyltransferase|nr:hypothetical protein [Desulfovibrionales bacterium]
MQFLVENGPLRLRPCRRGLTLYNVNDLFIGRSLELYHEAQENELGLLLQLIKPGGVVVDAGANIGVHTQCFAAAVGPEGRVASFEPQRALHQMLCANLALNGLGNVHTFNNALGAAQGVGFMPNLDLSAPQNFGAARLSDSQQGEEIPVVCLDQLKLPNCQLIKIDVEGMELEALLGAERIIKTHQPFIYIENSEEARSADLVQTLFDFGCDCYWHLPMFFNPENAAKVSENVFGKLVCINMLCVPRSKGLSIQGLKKLESAAESWREGALYLGA